MNLLRERLGFQSASEIDRSLEQKKKILKINSQKARELEGEKFEQLDLTTDYVKEMEYYIADFSADLLCGVIDRGHGKVTNWLEQLDSLTKMYLFESNKFSQIDEIFVTPINKDYPPVVKIKDKYYIGEGDGKHRLTIAKCIGNKKVTIRLIEYVRKV